jgi:hypothetical protein
MQVKEQSVVGSARPSPYVEAWKQGNAETRQCVAAKVQKCGWVVLMCASVEARECRKSCGAKACLNSTDALNWRLKHGIRGCFHVSTGALELLPHVCVKSDSRSPYLSLPLALIWLLVGNLKRDSGKHGNIGESLEPSHTPKCSQWDIWCPDEPCFDPSAAELWRWASREQLIISFRGTITVIDRRLHRAVKDQSYELLLVPLRM